MTTLGLRGWNDDGTRIEGSDNKQDQITYRKTTYRKENRTYTGCTASQSIEFAKYPKRMYSKGLFCNGDQSTASTNFSETFTYDFTMRYRDDDNTPYLSGETGFKRGPFRTTGTAYPFAANPNRPYGQTTVEADQRKKLTYETFKDLNPCSVLDDHPHQLQYCRNKCGFDCDELAPAERYNQTGYRTAQCANIASRMVQREALYNARSAFMVAIVFCQIAAILALKSRWLSIIQHGIGNPMLNVGIFASIMATALAVYSPSLNHVLSTRPIRFAHWMPSMPFAIIILVYDEVRKYFMRITSSTVVNEDGSKHIKIGWLEANTMY